MDRRSALQHSRDIVTKKAANSAIGVIFFFLATALGSYVRIPVAGSPVPITLQTFFVILSGAVLGRKLGALTQLLFAVSAGAYIFGPTGGYILGFVPAAYLAGLIAEKRRPDMFGALIAFAAGSVVIYASGALWLVSVYKMSPLAALTAGVLPFVPGDVAKMCLASIVYTGISDRARKIFQI